MSDLSVDIVGNFDYDVSQCTKADLWYYGRENEDFVYYERRIFGMDDKLFLENLCADRTHITATKFCSKRTLRARGSFEDLVNSISRLKSLQKGDVVIHAACVARDGFAVLMPAAPSTGKTLTTLQLLNKGYEYIADDTLVVDSAKKAYSNLMASAVGTYILNFVNLSHLKRMDLRLRSFLRRIPGATKIVSPFMGKTWELADNVTVSPCADVKVVCLLEVGAKSVEEISEQRAIDKIMAINQYSLSRPEANPVLLAYNLFNPRFNLHFFRSIEEKLLSDILDGMECYIVRCRDGQWGKLVEQVLSR